MFCLVEIPCVKEIEPTLDTWDGWGLLNTDCMTELGCVFGSITSEIAFVSVKSATALGSLGSGIDSDPFSSGVCGWGEAVAGKTLVFEIPKLTNCCWRGEDG